MVLFQSTFAKSKSLLAGALVALVLLLNVLAVSPGAHEWLHSDAGAGDHECAVTLFSHGFAGTAAAVVLVVLCFRLVATITSASQGLSVASPRYLHPPLCGPPQN